MTKDNKLDSWSNLLSGVSRQGRDKRTAWQVQTAKQFVEAELTELYHGNDLAQRICRLPAQEMVREWIDFRMPEGEDGEEVGRTLMQQMDELRLQSKVMEALSLARLYGTALIFVGADDGVDPAEPLNEENIRSIEFLTVLDRYEVDIDSWNQDPFSPDFGSPEVYRLQTEGQERVGALVHASRMLRFEGSHTARRRIRDNNGWSDSIFVNLNNLLIGYEATWSTVEVLMNDFAQGVFKMKNLAEIMAMNGENEVMKRLEIMDASRSVLRSLVLDAEQEEFSRTVTPMGGLPEILGRWMARVAAGVGMPQTLLFGVSPGGLSGQGDSEAENWANTVRAMQEEHLRSPLERMVKLMLNNAEGPTSGQEPEDWGFDFRNLRQMSALEDAQLRKVVADTDKIYIDLGVLLESEVALSRFGGDGYSVETVIDADLHSEMLDMEKEEALNPPPSPQELMMEGGPDDVPQEPVPGQEGLEDEA